VTSFLGVFFFSFFFTLFLWMGKKITCPKCQKRVPRAKFCADCGEKIFVKSKEYKFIVLGSGGVGKSAITVQFVSGQFVSQYNPTIEESFTKLVDVDGTPCRLEILDTAGTEVFTALRQLYYDKGDGYILVYSITSESSFHDLEPIWQSLVKAKNSTDIPLVLVGNKCDKKEERQVSTADGKAVAKQWNCYFLETSAKQAINIDRTFEELVRQIWRQEGKPDDEEEKSSKPCWLV